MYYIMYVLHPVSKMLAECRQTDSRFYQKMSININCVLLPLRRKNLFT